MPVTYEIKKRGRRGQERYELWRCFDFGDGSPLAGWVLRLPCPAVFLKGQVLTGKTYSVGVPGANLFPGAATTAVRRFCHRTTYSCMIRGSLSG
jgi:hypothetical protein